MNAISILTAGPLWEWVAQLAQLVSSALHVFLLTVGGNPVPQGDGPARLLRQGDLIHEGSFVLPDLQDTDGRNGFEWTNGTIAFNPTNQSLFVVGHEHGQQVAEINIPALGGRATVRQGFRDALEGRIGQINPRDPNAKRIGGLWVDRTTLIVAAFSYYDGGGTATSSHFVRSSTLATSGTLRGPFRVGTGYAGAHAGYFVPVPSEWQAALGTTLLNGSGPHAIVSLWSHGPSIAIVNPSELLAAANPSSATRLLWYDSAHALGPYCGNTSIGQPATPPNPLFNGTTGVTGAVIPANTRTILFMGPHGMGPCNYAPGSGESAPPYEPHVWAYDLTDLAAVKSGRKQPWAIKPYATWRLAGGLNANIGGVTIDPASGRIFVAENRGDGDKLRIHVFTIRPAGAASSAGISASAMSISPPAANPALTRVPLASTRRGSVHSQRRLSTSAYPTTGMTKGSTGFRMARDAGAPGSPARAVGTPSAPPRPLSAVLGDFNRDGQQDLLWEHANGSLYVWFMNGSRRLNGAYLAPAQVDPAWQIVGIADFDGDSHSDLLWQHGTGALHVWLMHGLAARAMLAPVSEAVAPTARVVATGDFNGDSRADIVWQEATSGAVHVWFMDGTVQVGASAVSPAPISRGWRIIGVADLNGDGLADLVWRDASNSLYASFMNGVAATRGELLTPSQMEPGWQAVSIGDFNGDAQPDLVWQHDTTGELSLWYLNGTQRTGVEDLSPRRVEPAWRIVGGSADVAAEIATSLH